MAKPTSVVFAPRDHPLPDAVDRWLRGLELPVARVRSADELMTLALRGRPRVVAFDARDGAGSLVWEACRRVKADSYTSVVPCFIIVGNSPEDFNAAFESGGDEVVRENDVAREVLTRLEAMLRRSDRDLTVHPSTRLPGAVEIEAAVQRRLMAGELFAMCYADLDHFKEFNDRYSYYDGDRVIRILAKILHDIVKGSCAEAGFVGHIGGDDFIFVIPVAAVNEVCAEIVNVFDTLIPFQYSEQDRRAGYFFGKDRRGQLHRVPLMTVSIGVVTNERRHFTHAAQVSELATEMKSYAKTLPGSVFSIDRRTDASPLDGEHHVAVTGTTAGAATLGNPGGGTR
ncbi:MAG TPA: GGDEF domain-containing protein [Gemmatimonadaceae bacterium]|nr:GGDEF domain-containing protein [Gemmatimonadaceae bacterium]